MTPSQDAEWHPTRFKKLQADGSSPAALEEGLMAATALYGLITAQEVADILGVSRKTVYRYAEAKTFPIPIKLPGGAYRFRRGELEDWLEERRVDPSEHDIEPWQRES
jgi:excisionase family DNA binding protein